MGMHEDDRIRAKNKVAQAAYDLYCNLCNEGLSDSAIAELYQSVIKNDPTNARNEIYSTVLKIVGRSNDNEEILVCRTTNTRSSDSD